MTDTFPCGCVISDRGLFVNRCDGHKEAQSAQAVINAWTSEQTSCSQMDSRMSVVMNDINILNQKDQSYGGSWKKRGGVGAFMMLARKWDRIENIMSKNTTMEGYGHANAYDIFQHIRLNPGEVLDDVRDLRRYLILVEAELLERGEIILDELL